MPGKQMTNSTNGFQRLCARCEVSIATLLVRTDYLCRECFANYVTSKVIKRMDGYKVRNVPKDKARRVLLSLSFGVSSTALLYILDRQLRTQAERTQRTGYELHVLFVDQSSVGGQGVSTDALRSLQHNYPTHGYMTALLEEVFQHCDVLDAREGMSLGKEKENSDSRYLKGHLQQFLSSLSSRTSQADVIGILRTRLIVAIAKQIGCESIIWGDSTTRLAEKTLSETAKGRGFSLPWQTGDGQSPYGISMIYPMRDLLRKEIADYVALTSPPLTVFDTHLTAPSKTPSSSKDVTIDDLMSQYFESVEIAYPSVVANVVRTSSKLTVSPSSGSIALCHLCNLPTNPSGHGLHGWGGDQTQMAADSSVETAHTASDKVLCYGCARSMTT